MDFPALSERILDATLQMGPVAAEVFAKTGSSSDVKMYHGKIESISTAEEEGIGVRFILPGGRIGYCYTVEPSDTNIRRILEEAIRGTEDTEGNPEEFALPGASDTELPDSEALEIWSPGLPGIPLGTKIDFLRRLEAAAYDGDPRVSWVDTVLYHDGWTKIHLRNSSGFHGSFRRTQAHVVLNVMASRAGEAVLSHHEAAACKFEGLDADRVGRAAAVRASAPLGGERIGPRRATVVLDAPVAAEILESLAPSFVARAHQRGRSLFQDRIGESIASSLLNIVDDGRLKGGLSTTPFDGEGTPTRRTVLAEEGVLQGALHDSLTAAKAGVSSTGSAVRRSYRDLPRPGTTNLHVLPGQRPTEEILLDVERAFHVLNLTSVGGVNPVTGNFSVAGSGVWMENGRDVHPVGGVTLSGDLKELLHQLVAVGDTIAWHHGNGSFGSPTLVVEGLTVAG